MLWATFLPIPLGEHEPNEKEKPLYILKTLYEYGILMPAEGHLQRGGSGFLPGGVQ